MSMPMFGLGKLHLKNGSIPSACLWFHKTAELGNSLAQYQLGKLLLSGGGVPKDVKRALYWLTASAKQGNQFAQYVLGKLYLLEKAAPQNQDAALHWFTLSAEQGNEYAQYFLGHLDDFRGASLTASAARLLHHMSRIFQEQPLPVLPGSNFVDSKLRRKIQEKKIAMGHKPDDHEEQTIAMC